MFPFIGISIANQQPSGVSYDPDALSFITATGITDSTIKTAINDFVLSTKGTASTLGNTLWSRLVNIKPNVGGNATAHSYNLKDTTTFQEIFVGSPTHSALGVVYNGITQYSKCGLIPNTAMSNTEAATGVYTQAGYSYIKCIIGSQSGVYWDLFGNYYQVGGAYTLGSNPSGVGGLRSVVVNGIVGYKGFVNANVDITTAIAPASLSTNESLTGAYSPSTYFAAATVSFRYDGKLSPADVIALYPIIQSFQTALSRNV